MVWMSVVMVLRMRAGLVGAVVAEREPLQMVIDSHAQVVRDPLADAFGVVVVDIGGDGAR